MPVYARLSLFLLFIYFLYKISGFSNNKGAAIKGNSWEIEGNKIKKDHRKL